MIVNPEDIIENQLVNVTINGKKFEGNPTETILDISERNGISIPRLCYMEGMGGMPPGMGMPDMGM